MDFYKIQTYRVKSEKNQTNQTLFSAVAHRFWKKKKILLLLFHRCFLFILKSFNSPQWECRRQGPTEPHSNRGGGGMAEYDDNADFCGENANFLAKNSKRAFIFHFSDVKILQLGAFFGELAEFRKWRGGVVLPTTPPLGMSLAEESFEEGLALELYNIYWGTVKFIWSWVDKSWFPQVVQRNWKVLNILMIPCIGVARKRPERMCPSSISFSGEALVPLHHPTCRPWFGEIMTSDDWDEKNVSFSYSVLQCNASSSWYVNTLEK